MSRRISQVQLTASHTAVRLATRLLPGHTTIAPVKTNVAADLRSKLACKKMNQSAIINVQLKDMKIPHDDFEWLTRHCTLLVPITVVVTALQVSIGILSSRVVT